MKPTKQLFYFLWMLLFQAQLNAQDTLTVAQLEPLTSYFTLEDGQLSGAGAELILEQARAARYTLIGEYHGSETISNFTEALLPELDAVGYKTLVLEIGPESGALLNAVPAGGLTRWIAEKFNQFGIAHEDGLKYPIPFVGNKSDVAFLEAGKRRDWTIFGIDQEYTYSLLLHAHNMVHRLSGPERKKHRVLYQRTVDTLNQYYAQAVQGEGRIASFVLQSELVQRFLTEMDRYDANRTTVTAIRKSVDIYQLNAVRQWFRNNEVRIAYQKQQLREGMKRHDLDPSADKMLVKMGSYHLSRGLSPLGLFEVGSTLSELAEFDGETALNISFLARFYEDESGLTDHLNSEEPWMEPYHELQQMGRKDAWTVIDLRPIVPGNYFYPIKYQPNEQTFSLARRYDLLIIPPVETEPVPAY